MPSPEAPKGENAQKSSRTAKQPTLKEIAAACGVSVGSVSQCLRNPDNRRFSEETRRRILQAARDLAYVPNRMAAGLREGRTNFLAMVVPWNTPEMLDCAEMEAKSKGYTLGIHFTVSPDLDAERTAIHHALSQRADGLIWMPSDTAWKYTLTLERIRTSGTRTVFLEEAVPGLPESGLVEVDYRTPLGETLDGLRKSGCARLWFLTPSRKHSMRDKRARFFETYCAAHGLDGRVIEDSDASMRVKRLETETRPDAVICEGDWAGLDVLACAESKGIRIPDDLQLVIVGDILVGGRYRISEISRPQITAIRRPSGEMAREAVRMLVSAIESNNHQELCTRTLNAKYIPRATTRPQGE